MCCVWLYIRCIFKKTHVATEDVMLGLHFLKDEIFEQQYFTVLFGCIFNCK
uniref:Uncharacterized protein n=1 Tax=Anguilla anguilla TaxID=7936 RepID=A0A0E9RZF4_ANGAN